MGERESWVLSAVPSGVHGMRIDLRLWLGPPPGMGRRNARDEEEDRDAGLASSACSAVGEGTTKLTEGGGGSSSVAAPGTAESGIVSASYDAARGSGMLDSNSPEEKSSEGEWDAGGEGGGRADEEEVKEARADEGEEERGGGDEEREGRPCSEITTIRGNTGGGGTEESDATKGGNFARAEEVVVREKKSRNMDGDNEKDTGRRCRRRNEGYLGHLLEAVRQASGGLFGDESPRKQEYAEERMAEGSKNSGGRYAPAAAAAAVLGPVVRSKRGRSQALPSRYRDSVLEPWRKYSGGGGGHRQLQLHQARNSR